MAKKDAIVLTGKVVEVLPSATFKVELSNGHVITAHVSGNIRRYYIKVLLGDKVDIEMSPYDLTKGRIVYRHK